MKKTLSFLLIGLCLASFLTVGCGKKEEEMAPPSAAELERQKTEATTATDGAGAAPQTADRAAVGAKPGN